MQNKEQCIVREGRQNILKFWELRELGELTFGLDLEGMTRRCGGGHCIGPGAEAGVAVVPSSHA